jgi:hypothetical protein
MSHCRENLAPNEMANSAEQPPHMDSARGSHGHLDYLAPRSQVDEPRPDGHAKRLFHQKGVSQKLVLVTHAYSMLGHLKVHRKVPGRGDQEGVEHPSQTEPVRVQRDVEAPLTLPQTVAREPPPALQSLQTNVLLPGQLHGGSLPPLHWQDVVVVDDARTIKVLFNIPHSQLRLGDI